MSGRERDGGKGSSGSYSRSSGGECRRPDRSRDTRRRSGDRKGAASKVLKSGDGGETEPKCAVCFHFNRKQKVFMPHSTDLRPYAEDVKAFKLKLMGSSAKRGEEDDWSDGSDYGSEGEWSERLGGNH